MFLGWISADMVSVPVSDKKLTNAFGQSMLYLSVFYLKKTVIIVSMLCLCSFFKIGPGAVSYCLFMKGLVQWDSNIIWGL